MLSDFNSIVAEHEMKGGSQNPSFCGVSQFRDMIQNCDLMDVGFQGSKFTWKHGNLIQRLDRVLLNMRWCMKFQNATIFHMPFFKSDHRVVLVQLKRRWEPNRHRRPFRFLAPWLDHGDFPDLMSRVWPRGSLWCDQIPKLHMELKSWNKIVFGKIFARKKRLLNRLEGVTNNMLAYPSVHLERTHSCLWLEYQQVLGQEELLWFQKSRSKWLYYGDRNTNFFHGITAVHRRKNSFDML